MSVFDELRNNPTSQKIITTLNRIGAPFSEEHLIRFDWRVISLLSLCLLLFVVNVSMKTSGSSMKHWNTFIQGDTTKQTHIGDARFIRFDEWGMHTPMILSQTQHDFRSDNPAIGAGRAALLMSLPVKTFPSILRPHLLSYFIFPVETAYSFAWNYKVYGMFCAVFLLLMLLTRNNFWMSVSGSLWLCYSSFIQWWYSTPEPEMIMAVSLVFIFFIYLAYAQRMWLLILSALGLAVYAVTFLLFFYPPHQIPLAYFIAFVLVGYVMSHHNSSYLKKHLALRSLGVVGVLALLALCFTSFMGQAQDTINLMTNTVYPGNRISTGGEISLSRYFGGFFDMFFSEKKFPLSWENVCEASNFVLLYPVVIVAMIVAYMRGQKPDRIQLMIVFYLVFMTVWMVVGYPEIIAKLSVLNRVKENRAFIGIGFASIVLVILFLTRGAAAQHADLNEASEPPANSPAKSKKKKAKAERASAPSVLSSLQLGSTASLQSLGVLVVLLVYGFVLNAGLENYFSTGQLIFAALFFAFLSHLIFIRQQAIFGWLIVVCVVGSNFMVNPVAFGMSPILDKPLMSTVQSIREKDPTAKWLYYGTNIIANYYIAAGADVISGSKFSPDLEAMKKLDPTGANKDIYNRFAQMRFMMLDSAKTKNDVVFHLDNIDGYSVFVNPCADQLQQIGVKYIATGLLPWRSSMSCIEPLFDKPISRTWIYKMREAGKSSRPNPLTKLERIDDLNRFRVGSLKISSNEAHDAFIINGVAFDSQTNDLAGGVYLDLDGQIFEGTYGLDNPNVSDARYRPSAFRIELPFSYTGRGHTEFKVHVLSKDKKSYGTSIERFAVDID